MEILRLNMAHSVAMAVTIIKSGGVIVYPTDTLYGLGVDALSDAAVEAIYAIKGRDKQKPIHAVFADVDMIEMYGEMNDVAYALAQAFLPGPLTLIIKKNPTHTTGICKDSDTIGIRIPDNQWCLSLVRAVGTPVTTTSANKSNESPQYTIDAIMRQFGDSAQYIALAIDDGEVQTRVASTVVDVSDGKVRIVREGAILASEIAKIVPL